MQPPMMPTNITTSQQFPSVQPSMQPNTSTIAMNRGVDAANVTNNAVNHQNAEVIQQQRQGTTESSTPLTSRQVEVTGPTNEQSVQTKNNSHDTQDRRNVHAEFRDRSTSESQFFQGKSHGGGNSDVRTTRPLLEDNTFKDFVRDNLSAQVKDGCRPMFVNNYYVGDNSWRTAPAEAQNPMTGIDTSTNRTSAAVQTAISSLGDQGTETYVQTGISKVKAMGNNDAGCNTQSPVVVEPRKSANTTGWSTNSCPSPDPKLNTPSQTQQCKGLPDFTVPQPATQQQQSSSKLEENLFQIVERMTNTMEQQMKLNTTKSEYNMTQNTRMMEQFIKMQDRRDLDPALMDIPTFTGEEPEKCLEWVTWIRNVCRQSGRSFQQELTNKSGLVVQNFLATIDPDILDVELIEKILQMFSDVPTTTQAISRLKSLRQGENESILAYNQHYRTLLERVEGVSLEHVTSPVSMEMYLGTIIPPLKKSIKNSLFWNSKHAPRTVGEAMTKAQQLHIKHLYTTGEDQDGDVKTQEDVVINEISRKFENRYRDRRNDFRDSSQNQNFSQDSRRWQSYNNNSSHQQRQYEPSSDTDQLNIDSSTNQKEEVQPPNSEQLTQISTTGQRDKFNTPTRRQN